MSGVIIKLTKSFKFDSAHFLQNHKGKCSSIHGHTYRLDVTVSRIGGRLLVSGSDEGMVIDFSDLKEIVKTHVIEKMDHKLLNDIFQFRTTAENLALYIFEILKEQLQPLDIKVLNIKLWETSDSCVEVGHE